MNITLVTAPVIEPIDLNDLKLHLRIELDETDEDEYLEGLITAAREQVEDITRRAIMTQTWKYYLESWPKENFIKLPFGNLQSDPTGTPVVAAPIIIWKDTAGTPTTLTLTTDYLVEKNGEGIGRIVLPYGEVWPSGTLYPSVPISIQYICGWTTAALVPGRIKSSIKLLAASLYEARGEPVLGQTVSENRAPERLLASCRLWDEFI